MPATRAHEAQNLRSPEGTLLPGFTRTLGTTLGTRTGRERVQALAVSHLPKPVDRNCPPNLAHRNPPVHILNEIKGAHAAKASFRYSKTVEHTRPTSSAVDTIHHSL